MAFSYFSLEPTPISRRVLINFPGSGRKEEKGVNSPYFLPQKYHPPFVRFPQTYKAASATPESRCCIEHNTPSGIRKNIYQLYSSNENLARFTDSGFASYVTTTLGSRVTPKLLDVRLIFSSRKHRRRRVGCPLLAIPQSRPLPIR